MHERQMSLFQQIDHLKERLRGLSHNIQWAYTRRSLACGERLKTPLFVSSGSKCVYACTQFPVPVFEETYV